ncbi:MAG: hypothetical protein HY875_14185 [Chloroflexi bacterium]|nr:hypothetical protein [Chloroflexota bacterium]
MDFFTAHGRRPMTFLQVLSAALAAVIVSAGCGGGGGAGAPEAPIRAIEGGVKIDAATRENILKNASDFQQAIFRDGVVTHEEYERATLAEIACLREAGLQFHEGPSTDALGRYYWALFYPAGSDVDRGRAEAQRCKNEYTDRIGMVWSNYRAPNYDEVMQSARDDLAACLREAGFDAPEHPREGELIQFQEPDMTRYALCVRPAQQKHNLPGWGGG